MPKRPRIDLGYIRTEERFFGIFEIFYKTSIKTLDKFLRVW